MIGRIDEIQALDRALQKEESQFVAVYGRRRIGKTYLIREKFRDQFAFYHTGVREGNQDEQLQAFRISLRQYGLRKCPRLRNWLDAFACLHELIAQGDNSGRKVVFLDELPWMDTPRSGMLTALEYFWNNLASVRREKDVFLVVCGSATSWMVRNLIHNEGGLHNRLTDQIWLRPFTLRECEAYAASLGLEMSRSEICEAYMIFGGVPYYWSLLRADRSLAQNVDELCFSPHGKLRGEFGYLYASLFRNPEPYLKVVEALSGCKSGIMREELIAKTGLRNGGNFKAILDDLVNCDFVRRYTARKKKNREAFFQLIDNFTLFYYEFLKDDSTASGDFWTKQRETPKLFGWRGRAFERVCLLHERQLKAALGISGIRTDVYSWRTRSEESGHRGAQVDLVIERTDGNINLCEMKHADGEYVLTGEEAERLLWRKSAFAAESGVRKTLRLTLVTPAGLVRNKHSGIIQNVVTLGDLFRE